MLFCSQGLLASLPQALLAFQQDSAFPGCLAHPAPQAVCLSILPFYLVLALERQCPLAAVSYIKDSTLGAKD